MQINFNKVYFSYNNKSPFKVDALKDINLSLFENNITAIVGKTGSGKSTLVELINKLLTPTSGEVQVDNFINKNKKHVKNKEIKNLRKNIGFLFQFSENQLFEESVYKDVKFGLSNFYPKESKENIDKYVKEALNLVGLDESFYSRSPFDLSGGEKKRVAIAGILAYRPKLLILDEPTAGLDSKGKDEIMDLFKKIHDKNNIAIILVSHDMDIVLKYADKMVIVDEGNIIKQGSPKKILLEEDLEKYNLKTPNIYSFLHKLKNNGFKLNDNNVFDIESLIKELKKHG